ncbi:sulfotransferase [Altererythrobacter fulvus]|uniref:tetratricopeptide repeat-containing sulfotransferase family protein n=1 Tax=Caenibius fulvus TaxID=2126012 RepID=UPI0030165F02
MLVNNLASVQALGGRLKAAVEQDDRRRTNDLIRELIRLDAPIGPQWHVIAQIAADNGEVTLARQALDLFTQSANDNSMAVFQKAGLLAEIGIWQDAYDLMSGLPEVVPDRASNAYSRGTSALYVGETEQARNLLELATDLRPQSGTAWHSLATLIDFASEPELAERLLAAGQAQRGASPIDQASYLYAVGKVHADRGDHALAFAAFADGARRMTAIAPYSRERDRIGAQEAVNGYTAARIAELGRKQREATDRTIFVMGLPRSGTTLVEQILTSHSAVSDGGEINRLGLFAKDVAGVSYDALARYAAAEGAPEIARLWHHWLDERFPGSGRIVDKTNNSSRLLGFAASLLPQAPLIWLRRDPLDCAWSCFRTCFMHRIPWSYDLEDIAFHFQLEDALMARWQEILGDRLLVVSYESLVTQPEIWIRRILQHCGLAEEPQVFSPHENRRTVTTSSVMQVRKPINRAGIGAAQPYREFLAPFVRAYQG